MTFAVISRALSCCTYLSLGKLCSVARVSRSGYDSWSKRLPKVLDKVDLLIKSIFEKGNAKSGYRTIKMALEREYGLIINHKRIIRSMRLQKLVTKIRRKKYPSVTTETSCAERAFPNIVKRDFSPQSPDSTYSADVTEFKIRNDRKVYLYAAKDLCSKDIVAYNVSVTPDAALVTDTLRERLLSLSELQRKKLVYHTDQGGVFMCNAHINMTKSLHVTQSMSQRGNCLDNAPIESFFGHLKDEIDISLSRDIFEAKEVIARYIDLYNNDRPQWGLNRKTPAECRGSYN